MLSLLLMTLLTAQHPHPTDRAGQVMGFDQDRTAHHFLLYADGGAIDVSAKDAKEPRDAIRTHLSHIAMMFKEGDFEAPMLVHDTKNVPGIDVLAARRGQISYKYSETPVGGRIDIVTSDPDALAALHEFLRYQIREHKTGDSGSVAARR